VVVFLNPSQLFLVNLLAVFKASFIFTITHVQQVLHNLVGSLTGDESFFEESLNGWSFEHLKFDFRRSVPVGVDNFLIINVFRAFSGINQVLNVVYLALPEQ
jgi:hypothetical protein